MVYHGIENTIISLGWGIPMPRIAWLRTISRLSNTSWSNNNDINTNTFKFGTFLSRTDTTNFEEMLELSLRYSSLLNYHDQQLSWLPRLLTTLRFEGFFWTLNPWLTWLPILLTALRFEGFFRALNLWFL